MGAGGKRKQLPSQLSQLIPTAARPCRAKPELLTSIFTPTVRQQQGEGHGPAQPPAPQRGSPILRRLPPATVTSPRGLARGLRLPQPPRGLPSGRSSPVGHRPVPLREAQSPGTHGQQQQQQQPGAAPGRLHGGPAWLWAPRRARHRPGGGERRQGARPRGRDQKKRRKLQWGCFSFLFIFFPPAPPLVLRKSAR